MNLPTLLAIVFFGSALAVFWVVRVLEGRTDPVGERLAEIGRMRAARPLATESLPDPESDPTAGAGWMQRLRKALFAAIDRFMAGRALSDRTAKALRRADLKLRVSEWAALSWGAALGGVVLGVLAGGPLLALVGLLAGVYIPPGYLSYRTNRRRRMFDAQLPDALSLISNALRSGHSLLQALEVASHELPAPASDEFGQVIRETRVGISVEDALGNLTERMPSDDLDLIVTAVLIQRQVGGNLAEVLDKINATIRDRIRILGQIRTLTAQGRLSGWIVSALPVGVGVMIYLLNPQYIDPLIGQKIGWIMLGAGAVLQAIGMTIISSIVNFEV